MRVAKEFWAGLVHIVNYFTFSTLQDDTQQPILGTTDTHAHGDNTNVDLASHKPSPPIYGPGPIWEVDGKFKCNYTAMWGWERCNWPYDRGCWLRNKYNNSEPPYDIDTNYEARAPIGILRNYTLEITPGTWNTDGYPSQNMKLINGKYPGPWIQACWGDRIRVTVINKLRHNGTAIHWHGIRQLNSMHMDGVPGITQCPIAPGHSMVYEFDTTQYGDSWYHSHYSVQYADGMLGPMTIYGPSTAPYDDDPVDASPARPGTGEGDIDIEDRQVPLLMSDWYHNSSFGIIHKEQEGFGTILLNGRGNISNFNETIEKPHKKPKKYPKPTMEPPSKFELNFKPRTENPLSTPKRHLLRLINTSFSTSFVFSIDHHTMQIISADFVPVIPSEPKSHILIGIGQRYNVIVTADPVSYVKEGVDPPADGNFWIRTTAAVCFNSVFTGMHNYDATGILRYNSSSKADANSTPWPEVEAASKGCQDERKLIPKLPWFVPSPLEGNKSYEDVFDVGLVDKKSRPAKFPLAMWSFEAESKEGRMNPFQIDYGNITFLNLDNIDQNLFKWEKSWVIVSQGRTEEDWVYLALSGANRSQVIGSHPMHLHGHDFAEIASGKGDLPDDLSKIKYNLDNPIRRDVVLLPHRGYVVIAFKTDNPGSWIMHCHIAFHASEGLALQILERQEDANKMWPKGSSNGEKTDPAIAQANQTCNEWRDWHSNCTRWWPGERDGERFLNPTIKTCFPSCGKNDPKQRGYACAKDGPAHIFMDDSGI